MPACALGVLVSCGGGKQEPAAPPAAVAEAPKVEALPPLAKVAAPAELFAVARIPNAAKTADTGVAWSGLPVNWRSILDKEAPGLSQAALFDVPIDFAAMLDPASIEAPRVLWAFSVGAPSTDVAAAFFRSQGAHVTQEAAGAYRVQLGNGLSCMLVRALGAAPARVVCSEDAADADALGPYMSCGMPTESFGQGEFHAHITAEPFRRRYGSQVTLVRTVGVPFLLRELSLDHPKFDRALRDVLYGLSDEVIALAYDLDRIDFDAVLATGGNELDASTAIGMAGQRSWLAQMTTTAASRGAPAPEFFWRLPADTMSASYSAPGDPDRMRGIAAALRELADGWLDYHKLPEKKRTALVEAMEQALTAPGPAAYAKLPDETEPAPPASGASVTPESVKAAIGENLLVMEQGGDRLDRFASELVKSVGDPALRKHLVQSNVLAAAEIPTGSQRAPKFAKGLAPKTKVYELTIPLAALESASRAARAGRGRGKALPPPRSEKPGGSVKVVMVSMPDGPLTWFAVGTDEKLLETRLADIKAGTGPALATRTGLAALKTESAVSAGFSSLAVLIEAIRDSLGGKDAPSLKTLSLLPHRGEVPLLWRGTADANGPKLVGTARLPRELVEDLVAMGATSAAGSIKK